MHGLNDIAGIEQLCIVFPPIRLIMEKHVSASVSDSSSSPGFRCRNLRHNIVCPGCVRGVISAGMIRRGDFRMFNSAADARKMQHTLRCGIGQDIDGAQLEEAP